MPKETYKAHSARREKAREINKQKVLQNRNTMLSGGNNKTGPLGPVVRGTPASAKCPAAPIKRPSWEIRPVVLIYSLRWNKKKKKG